MEDSLIFNDDAFYIYMNNSISDLQKDIKKCKDYLRVNGGRSRYKKEADFYVAQINRLAVLELIEQLQLKNITKEDFDEKVKLKKISLSI